MSEQHEDKSRMIEMPAPLVRVAHFGEIHVYPITRDELDQLSEGSTTSLLLNFGLWFLATAVSFLSTLLVTSFKTDRTFLVFLVICVVSFVAAIVLLILWMRGRKSQKLLIERIKDRMPPNPGEREGTALMPIDQ